MTQLMLIAALVLVEAGAFAIIEIHYRKIQKEEKQRVAAMLESLEDPDYCDLAGIENMVERNLSDEEILRRCRHRRQYEVFRNTHVSTVEESTKAEDRICQCANDTSEDCLTARRKKTA